MQILVQSKFDLNEQLIFNRDSRPLVFCKKAVLKNVEVCKIIQISFSNKHLRKNAWDFYSFMTEFLIKSKLDHWLTMQISGLGPPSWKS